MSKSKIFCDYKHPFRFQIPGRDKPLTFWAKVRHAKEHVELKLTAKDVIRSMQLKGTGNTQTCSMALCAKRLASEFPHPVSGFIDWSYSRAHVVTKVRSDGTPSECVVYRHDDDVAHLNDEPEGQKRLLSELKKNGDMLIRLHPINPKTKGKSGKRTGSGGGRKARPINLKGANLRFAVAQLGGVDDK